MKNIIKLIILLLLCVITARAANPHQPLTIEPFVQISGIPEIIGKDRCAFIIISQVYDASRHQPVKMLLDVGKSGVEVSVMHSVHQRYPMGNRLSYELTIYRLDFLKAMALAIKRENFENLPPHYVVAGMKVADKNKGEALLVFTLQ